MKKKIVGKLTDKMREKAKNIINKINSDKEITDFERAFLKACSKIEPNILLGVKNGIL